MIFAKYYNIKNQRSKEAVINILLSSGTKCITIIVSLMVVPLTINYINPTQYGVWLTVSTIISWIGFFDLGIVNGFRNKFAESIANGNMMQAKQYVSTTYFIIGLLMTIVLFVVLVVNHFLYWDQILNIDSTYRDELKTVIAILTCFFCVNFVARTFSTMLIALQRPGYAALIDGVGSILSLVVIYILTNISDGSLTLLALYYSGIPCIVMIIVSVFAYNKTTYKQFAPSIKYVRKDLINNIVGLGFQFFLISISLLLIFQLVNIVISREIGSLAVTQYNISYKIFNILHMFITIIITPFWSAFTDAYVKGDFLWMKSVKRKLEYCWLIEVFVGIILLSFSQFFYKLWLGNSVEIPFVLSCVMLLYILTQSIGSIYMNLLNGLGRIRIQLITYCVYAVISWPLLVYSSRHYGLSGVIIAPTLVCLTQAIVCGIQINKILNKTDCGIWSK